MKTGILETGGVAAALGNRSLKHGHEVALGKHTPSKFADWTKDVPPRFT